MVPYEKRYPGILDKKVLLRERKRHTTSCVASARHVALSPDGGGGGYPLQSWTEGDTPFSLGWGVLHPVLGRGYPHPDLEPDLDGRYLRVPPVQTWDGVPPHSDMGWGTPCLDMGMGYPPPQVWTDTCENSTFPHTSYAGGNDVAKLGTFVCKIILQKYTSLRIDVTDVLVFIA